jgi:hypothetical protein
MLRLGLSEHDALLRLDDRPVLFLIRRVRRVKRPPVLLQRGMSHPDEIERPDIDGFIAEPPDAYVPGDRFCHFQRIPSSVSPNRGALRKYRNPQRY